MSMSWSGGGAAEGAGDRHRRPARGPPGPMPFEVEGRGDLAQAQPRLVEFEHAGEGALLGRLGDQLPILGPLPVRRAAVGEPAALVLERAAAFEPQQEQLALVLGDGAQDATDQLAGRVRRIVAEVRLAAGGGEHLAAGPPHLGEELLLDEQIPGEPVEAGDDQPASTALLEVGEGGGQAEPDSEALRTGAALIPVPTDQPMPGRRRPGPDGTLLLLEPEALLNLPVRAHAQVADKPHGCLPPPGRRVVDGARPGRGPAAPKAQAGGAATRCRPRR